MKRSMNSNKLNDFKNGLEANEPLSVYQDFYFCMLRNPYTCRPIVWGTFLLTEDLQAPLQTPQGAPGEELPVTLP